MFLADTGTIKSPPEQFKAISSWPALRHTPENFLLSCKQSKMSPAAFSIRKDIEAFAQESINLLYVASTRTKQILVMTGVGGKSKQSWHHFVCNALNIEANSIWEYEVGEQPSIDIQQNKDEFQQSTYDNAVLHPITPIFNQTKIIDNEATRYGIALHKCLEILSHNIDIDEQTLMSRVAIETDTHNINLIPIIDEAKNCLRNSSIRSIFELEKSQKAYSEIEISHTYQNTVCISVIDRLIIDDHTAWIIDYKTDSNVTKNNAQEHAKRYRSQLTRYREAVSCLHPNLVIRSSILFTKIPMLLNVNL